MEDGALMRGQEKRRERMNRRGEWIQCDMVEGVVYVRTFGEFENSRDENLEVNS